MDQMTITASGEVNGVMLTFSATIPSDDALRRPEDSIAGLGVSRLQMFARIYSAEVCRQLFSAEQQILESLQVVHKNHNCSSEVPPCSDCTHVLKD